MIKKIITLLALAFCLNGWAQTPYVAIPDSNFVHYLKTIVPTAFKGDSLNTSSTLVTTTTQTISVNSYSITSLSGVQYFTSLTNLTCQSNYSLTTLPPLPNSLTYLDCQHNYSLTTLPSLPNSLTYLDCDNNSLTSLPTLPNSLTYLDCDSNNITCFPTFPSSITTIHIYGNPFNCLPNYIASMIAYDTTHYPLCAAGNSNGCPISCNITPTVSYTLTNVSPHHYDAVPAYSSNITNARWYWGDGTDTLALYPSHTYSVAGRYNICVTAYSSCGDSTNFCQSDSIYRTSSSSMVYINVKQSATGIVQISALNSNVAIYPNPNNGSFVIELNSLAKQTMQVYDVSGKLVLSQTITGKTTIDASTLNEGVYNISLQSNEGVVNKRLVIVR